MPFCWITPPTNGKPLLPALALVTHYPDRAELVERCIALAVEELTHFQAVQVRIADRGLALLPDTRSEYLRRLTQLFREGREPYFLDRLLTAGIVEARGCERFGLLAAALPPGPMKDFYREIARTEVRHQELYIDLARLYSTPPRPTGASGPCWRPSRR